MTDEERERAQAMRELETGPVYPSIETIKASFLPKQTAADKMRKKLEERREPRRWWNQWQN